MVIIFYQTKKGFEPRGTDISNRLATWMKLQENTGPGKSLSPVPWQLTEATTARYFFGDQIYCITYQTQKLTVAVYIQ